MKKHLILIAIFFVHLIIFSQTNHKTFFDNGNLKEIGPFDENGTLSENGSFKNGDKRASWKFYDEEGNLTETKKY